LGKLARGGLTRPKKRINEKEKILVRPSRSAGGGKKGHRTRTVSTSRNDLRTEGFRRGLNGGKKCREGRNQNIGERASGLGSILKKFKLGGKAEKKHWKGEGRSLEKKVVKSERKRKGILIGWEERGDDNAKR